MPRFLSLFAILASVACVFASVDVCGAAGGSGATVTNANIATVATFTVSTSSPGSSITANAGSQTFTVTSKGLIDLGLIVGAITQNAGYACSCLPFSSCPSVVSIQKNGASIGASVPFQGALPPPYRFSYIDYANANDVYRIVVIPCSGGTLTGGSVSATVTAFTLEEPVCA